MEVALDVQFEALSRLRGPQLGLFWSEIRDRFPTAEEQNALPPLAMETFERGRVQGARIELTLLDTPPVPRSWFVNSVGSELIQVQPDRFIVNWRRAEGVPEYPHYGHVRQLFSDEFSRFREFVLGEKLGEIVPTQCAVTYFNEIVSGIGWDRHGELHEIIAAWKRPEEGGAMPEPDEVRFTARYTMSDGEARPIGRLHVELQPVFRQTDTIPIYVLTLTARGRPDGESTEGVLRFFDQGQAWATRAFVALTTPKMHALWRGE